MPHSWPPGPIGSGGAPIAAPVQYSVWSDQVSEPEAFTPTA
jgi:hypothetical protein